ncbi:hypothetical protein QZH41_002041 [Actinostola sp. cb2023]|nr:hypothetical protein QZH41_002041 [Actinostola sp. cb2023]
MTQALKNIAILPFALTIDFWRWKAFSGEISPDEYNGEWWRLKREYQGVVPPVERTEKDFDPGANSHICNSTPYASNVATIVTFSVNRRLFRRGVYCLINLAASDMFYGACLAVDLFYALSVDNAKFKVPTAVLRILTSFAMVASGLCLLLVALERVFATFLPFRHRTTRPRVYAIGIALTWCLSLFISVTNQFARGQIQEGLVYFYWCFAVLCLLIIVVSYTAIFVKVKFQNQLHQQHGSASQAAQLRERNMANTVTMARANGANAPLAQHCPTLLVKHVGTVCTPLPTCFANDIAVDSGIDIRP